jgi:hypothetical protein
MKIKLIKVGSTALDFEEKSDEITFKGYLQYDANKLILLKATLSGKINTNCDVCADEFDLNVNEDIEFYLHSGIYESENETLLDVVECLDDTLDLQEILNSEIELIKSDYNTCKNCKN